MQYCSRSESSSDRLGRHCSRIVSRSNLDESVNAATHLQLITYLIENLDWLVGSPMQRRCSISCDIYKYMFACISLPNHHNVIRLCTLTAPQSHSLAVLLKLGDKLISLPHDVIILLVLIIWPIGLDDPLSSDTINGTWDSLGCDELCKITRINQ
jgi:hypothetical protein